MNKIASFTVNHLDLLAGVYVSRKDYQGDVVLTTFDLRFTRPNVEAPMDTAGIHHRIPKERDQPISRSSNRRRTAGRRCENPAGWILLQHRGGE